MSRVDDYLKKYGNGKTQAPEYTTERNFGRSVKKRVYEDRDVDLTGNYGYGSVSSDVRDFLNKYDTTKIHTDEYMAKSKSIIDNAREAQKPNTTPREIIEYPDKTYNIDYNPYSNLTKKEIKEGKKKFQDEYGDKSSSGELLNNLLNNNLVKNASPASLFYKAGKEVASAYDKNKANVDNLKKEGKYIPALTDTYEALKGIPYLSELAGFTVRGTSGVLNAERMINPDMRIADYKKANPNLSEEQIKQLDNISKYYNAGMRFINPADSIKKDVINLIGADKTTQAADDLYNYSNEFYTQNNMDTKGNPALSAVKFLDNAGRGAVASASDMGFNAAIGGGNPLAGMAVTTLGNSYAEGLKKGVENPEVYAVKNAIIEVGFEKFLGSNFINALNSGKGINAALDELSKLFGKGALKNISAEAFKEGVQEWITEFTQMSTDTLFKDSEGNKLGYDLSNADERGQFFNQANLAAAGGMMMSAAGSAAGFNAYKNKPDDTVQQDNKGDYVTGDGGVVRKEVAETFASVNNIPVEKAVGAVKRLIKANLQQNRVETRGRLDAANSNLDNAANNVYNQIPTVNDMRGNIKDNSASQILNVVDGLKTQGLNQDEIDKTLKYTKQTKQYNNAKNLYTKQINNTVDKIGSNETSNKLNDYQNAMEAKRMMEEEANVKFSKEFRDYALSDKNNANLSIDEIYNNFLRDYEVKDNTFVRKEVKQQPIPSNKTIEEPKIYQDTQQTSDNITNKEDNPIENTAEKVQEVVQEVESESKKVISDDDIKNTKSAITDLIENKGFTAEEVEKYIEPSKLKQIVDTSSNEEFESLFKDKKENITFKYQEKEKQNSKNKIVEKETKRLRDGYANILNTSYEDENIVERGNNLLKDILNNKSLDKNQKQTIKEEHSYIQKKIIPAISSKYNKATKSLTSREEELKEKLKKANEKEKSIIELELKAIKNKKNEIYSNIYNKITEEDLMKNKRSKKATDNEEIVDKTPPKSQEEQKLEQLSQKSIEKPFTEKDEKEYIDAISKTERIKSRFGEDGIEHVTTNNPIHKDIKNYFYDKLGVNVIFYDSNSNNTVRGFADLSTTNKNVIFIKDSLNPKIMEETIWHEFTHTLEKTATYNELVKYLNKKLSQEAINSYIYSYIPEKSQKEYLGDNNRIDAIKEMIADNFGNEVKYMKFWQDLKTENNSLFVKLKKILVRAFNSVKTYFFGNKYFTNSQAIEVNNYFRSFVGDLGSIKKADEIVAPFISDKNIKLSEKNITETENFKRWFQGSKVVGEDGKPLKVYRSSDVSPNIYTIGEVGYHFGTLRAATEKFIYDKERDGKIKGTNITPVYLSLKNPLRVPDLDNFTQYLGQYLFENNILSGQEIRNVFDKLGVKDELEAEKIINEEEKKYGPIKRKNVVINHFVVQQALIKLLQKKGYDGLIYTNKFEHVGSTSYVVFTSNQIKSAIGNSGDFDAKNPDIRFSEAPTETENFKRWFRNSKIVDKNGNPLVVYHGTPYGNFNIFKQKDKGNTKHETRKLGFFFTDDLISAEEFRTNFKDFEFNVGSKARTYKVFLSLQNPFIYDFEYSKDKDKSIYYELSELKWEFEEDIINMSDKEKLTIGEANRLLRDMSARKKIDPFRILSVQAQLKGAKQLRDELIEKGYDGIVVDTDWDIGSYNRKTNDERNIYPDTIKQIIAFYPEQIKSATKNNGNFDINNPDIRFAESDIVNHNEKDKAEIEEISKTLNDLPKQYGFEKSKVKQKMYETKKAELAEKLNHIELRNSILSLNDTNKMEALEIVFDRFEDIDNKGVKKLIEKNNNYKFSKDYNFAELLYKYSSGNLHNEDSYTKQKRDITNKLKSEDNVEPTDASKISNYIVNLLIEAEAVHRNIQEGINLDELEQMVKIKSSDEDAWKPTLLNAIFGDKLEKQAYKRKTKDFFKNAPVSVSNFFGDLGSKYHYIEKYLSKKAGTLAHDLDEKLTGRLSALNSVSMIDKDGKVREVSYAAVLDEIINKGDTKIKGDIRRKFYVYLWHKNNIDAAKYGKNTMYDTKGRKYTSAESEVICREFEKQFTDFEKKAKRLTKWINTFMEVFGVEEGIISRETFDRITKLYPFYIPKFKDATDIAILDELFSSNYKTNLLDNSTPIKTLTGSPLDYYDAFESISLLMDSTMKTAYANRIFKELYRVAPAHPELISRLDKDSLEKSMTAQGKKFMEARQVGGDILPADVFGGLINGERYYIKFKSEKGKEGEVIRKIKQELSTLNKTYDNPISRTWFNMVNFSKALYVSTVSFATSTHIADLSVAWFNTESIPRFIYNLFPSYSANLFNIKTKRTKELYDLFLSQGFNGTGYYNKSKPKSVRDITGERAIYDADNSIKTYKNELLAIRVVDAAKTIATYCTDRFELVSRFAEFMSVYERTGSIEEATQAAKDITVDLSRRGKYSQLLDSVFLFSTAAINANYNMAKTIKRHPARTAYRAAIMATIIAGFIISSLDDKDYENTTKSNKLNYIPAFGKLKFKTQNIATFITNMVHYSLDKDISLSDSLLATVDKLNPLNTPAFKAIYEFFVEGEDAKNSFGTPLLTSDQKELSSYLQYEDSTNILITKVSEAINNLIKGITGKNTDSRFISPILVESIIKDRIGSYYTYVNQLTSNKAIENYKDGNGAESLKNLGSSMFVKPFIINTESNKDINNFYENYDDVKRLVRDSKATDTLKPGEEELLRDFDKAVREMAKLRKESNKSGQISKAKELNKQADKFLKPNK